MLMAGQRLWADASGVAGRAHPHCKGGWVRMAVFRASAATTPMGMSVAGGVRGLFFSFSGYVPRTPHRAAPPGYRAMAGRRCADARSALQSRSSGTAT